MLYPHIRNTDLNLLLSFQALMQERSVTRAAQRMGLTQSAMSRVVDRLQKMLGDDLFMRTAKGYEPTHRALTAYAELEQVLPRIEAVLRGNEFDPTEATDIFRIEASDSSAVLFIPRLLKVAEQHAPGVQIEVVPRSGGFGRLESNDVDLVIAHDIEMSLWTGRGVPFLRSEALCKERLVCLIRAGNPLARGRLTLARYLNARHLAIWAAGDPERIPLHLMGERQRLVAHVLEPLRKHRDVRVRIPYGLVVGSIIENTDLVATILSRIAQRLLTSKMRIVSAPPELRGSIVYNQVWHPLNDSNPVHQWLREVMRTVGAQLNSIGMVS